MGERAGQERVVRFEGTAAGLGPTRRILRGDGNMSWSAMDREAGEAR